MFFSLSDKGHHILTVIVYAENAGADVNNAVVGAFHYGPPLDSKIPEIIECAVNSSNTFVKLIQQNINQTSINIYEIAFHANESIIILSFIG